MDVPDTIVIMPGSASNPDSELWRVAGYREWADWRYRDGPMYGYTEHTSREAAWEVAGY